MIVAYIQHTLVKHLGGRMCSQPHCTTIGGVVWGGLYVCTELMQCFASLFSVNDMQEESGLGVRRHFKPESCTVVTLSAFAVAFLQTVSRQCCLLCQDGGFYECVCISHEFLSLSSVHLAFTPVHGVKTAGAFFLHARHECLLQNGEPRLPQAFGCTDEGLAIIHLSGKYYRPLCTAAADGRRQQEQPNGQHLLTFDRMLQYTTCKSRIYSI